MSQRSSTKGFLHIWNPLSLASPSYHVFLVATRELYECFLYWRCRRAWVQSGENPVLSGMYCLIFCPGYGNKAP